MRKISTMALLLVALPMLFSACVDKVATAPPPAATPKTTAMDTREPWQKTWDTTVEAAKKEGEVMLYATVGAETVRELTAAFNKKYGIQLSFLTMQRGPEVTERVMRERSAGLYIVDLVMPGTTTLISVVKPSGILDPVEPLLILPETKDPNAWYGGRPFLDKDGMVVPVAGAFNRYVLENTSLVKPGEIKAFTDLLDPKWKGKMIVNDPSQSGAGNSWVALMVKAWGLEKTKDFMRQFVKQDPAITRDGRLLVETVAHGKYLLGIAPRVEITAEFMGLSAPIALVKTVEGGNIAGSVGLSLPSHRPHPNAATVFANWLLTKEGMQTFMKGFNAPVVRKDISFADISPIFLPEAGEKVDIDDEESLMIKGTVLLEAAQEAFAPLLK